MARLQFRPPRVEAAVWYRFDTAAETKSPVGETLLGPEAEAFSYSGELPQIEAPDGIATLYLKRLTGQRGAAVGSPEKIPGFDANPVAAAVGSGTSGSGGLIVYVHDGTNYVLAPGNTDNGTAPRLYQGTVDPASTAGYAARTGDVWAGAPDAATAKYTVGSWFRPGIVTGTAAMTSGRMYGLRMAVVRRQTFDMIGGGVTVAAAGATLRFGVCADNGGILPGALLAEAATTADAATTGDKTAALALTLDPGHYWLVCAVQGGAPTMRVINSNDPLIPLAGPTSTQSVSGVYRDAITGVLPTPFGTAVTTGGAVPALALRAA